MKRVTNKLVLCLAISLSIAACGKEESSTSSGEKTASKESKSQESKETNQTKPKEDACDKNHFGADCKPCTCVNGTCNDGQKGDGSCTCKQGFSGKNCDECTIEDGTQGIMDDADNKPYLTTTINCRVWMATNMAYEGSDVTCRVNDSDSSFKSTYGCLYTFDDAMKVCPSGWHLPTEEEFMAMLDYVDEHKRSENAFLALIASSGWLDSMHESIIGGDDFKFRARPAGRCLIDADGDEYFEKFGLATDFWTSTKSTDEGSTIVRFDDGIAVFGVSRTDGRSVRCLKD